MIRLGLLLLLCFTGAVRAEPVSPAFDPERLARTYAQALAFLAPRVLDPVPVSVLTARGLQGLTGLDPQLQVAADPVRLVLRRRGAAAAEVPAPRDESPAGWGRAAAGVSAAAYDLSAAVRRAGEQEVARGFFDELFSRIDPYSRYVPPADAGADRSARAGRAGTGLALAQRGGGIEVRAVARDSPAAIAGIRPGEALLSVDGQRTRDQDLATIESLLAGREGAAVALSLRGRDGRVRDVSLVRALLVPETVFAQRSADILVLRITGFSNTTASHIALSVQDAMTGPRPVAGVVLDLRGNRGGLLRQAVTAADTFLPDGLVAVTVGRDPDASRTWRSAEGELAENVPVVVLVDAGTASAAEVLAAALADRGRAVVVGSATFGKGLVQTIAPLPDGGALFVTWSRVLAPLGWPLQGLGVLPQVCTSLGEAALAGQLADLAAGSQPMAAAIARQRRARVPVTATESLAIRAPCPGAEGRALDMDAARALVADPAAYAAALLPPMRER